MNIENVKALAGILSQNGLSSLEVIEGDTKIRLEKEASPAPVAASHVAPAAPAVSDAPGEAAAGPDEQTVDFNRLIEVKSPLVGVFYSSPTPDSDAFVSIGSKVKKGDVLCIIETMKLMNEVTAEQDGEIVDICIKNGDIAEFSQVLFKMF